MNSRNLYQDCYETPFAIKCPLLKGVCYGRTHQQTKGD